MIRSRLKANVSIPDLSSADGEVVSSDSDKARLFKLEFGNNFTVENGIIPHGDVHSTRYLPALFPPDLIYKYLLKLPNKFSFSLEGINQFMMKKSALSIALPIALIFKQSIDEGVLPNQWKSSVTVPIHKKGPTSNPANYRPITLTSPVCRLFEKILADDIRNVFIDRFSTKQFGFLSKRSCELALLSSITEWQRSLKINKHIDVLYFDFKKAFDMVSHTKLLVKLARFGLDTRITRWVENSLKGRISFLKLNNFVDLENPMKIESGVLQGTLLGPLWFLIYINDLPNCIPDSVNHTLFADDLKIYGSNSPLLQLAIDKIMQWSDMWQLPIAPNKTNVLHLGRSNVQFSYKVADIIIDSTEVVRDLGVIIDNKLTFENHIIKKVGLAKLRCNQILKAFHFKNPDRYFSLYTTYVAPITEYCSTITCPRSNSALAKKLEQPLRSFSKKVYRRCGIPFSSYEERLSKSHMLSMYQRRKLADLMLARKILGGLTYDIQAPFKFCKSVRLHYCLESLSNLFVSDNWFYSRVVRSWNLTVNRQAFELNIDKFKDYLLCVIKNY